MQTTFTSDHRLVAATLRMRNVYLPPGISNGRDTKTDYSYLQSPKIRDRYQAEVANTLWHNWDNGKNPNEMYAQIRT
jgi:hypothetical protein